MRKGTKCIIRSIVIYLRQQNKKTLFCYFRMIGESVTNRCGNLHLLILDYEWVLYKTKWKEKKKDIAFLLSVLIKEFDIKEFTGIKQFAGN